MRKDHRRHQGFTLIEIAIVLIIIGMILGGILNSQSVIRNAETKDTIKGVSDMAAAAQQFHDRYGNWPGALTNAVTFIPNLNPLCVGNASANGEIASALESRCASEELIRSTMLRGTATDPITIHGTTTLSVTGATAALTGMPNALLPVNWVNVIRIQAIDCDVAIQLDRAMDDGDVSTGNFRAAVACPGQDQNVLVNNAVLRLN